MLCNNVPLDRGNGALRVWGAEGGTAETSGMWLQQTAMPGGRAGGCPTALIRCFSQGGGANAVSELFGGTVQSGLYSAVFSPRRGRCLVLGPTSVTAASALAAWS